MPRAAAIDEATIKRNIEIYLDRLDGEITTMTEKAAELRKLLGGFGGKVGNAVKVNKAKKSKGKRGRRTPEQLKTHAEEIIAAIKAKGAEGASAADLAKFDYGVSLKDFLKKHGHALRSTGKSSAMRYFVK
jgi:hypothetical protein